MTVLRIAAVAALLAATVCAVFVPRVFAAEAKEEGFVSLFNGKDLAGWEGSTKGYVVQDGRIVCKKGGGGNLWTKREFADFHLKFEFLLTPGANNGLGVRMAPNAHAAFQAMELQILDNTAEKYAKLKPYQYHGSVYGVVPAKRGHLKPVGEWNQQEVIARKGRIQVILNGHTIVDADVWKIDPEKTMDKRPHPGLHNKKGRIGFLGHGAHVEFRNLRIKELTE